MKSVSALSIIISSRGFSNIQRTTVAGESHRMEQEEQDRMRAENVMLEELARGINSNEYCILFCDQY